MKHKPEAPSRWRRFADWVNGDWTPERESPIQGVEHRPPAEEPPPPSPKPLHPHRLRRQLTVYRIVSVAMCIVMVATLLYTVAALPYYGSPDAPSNNEVAQRYVARGTEETGAVNTVAGMILDYRAFDTFGESTVLFAATMAVMFLTLTRHTKELEAKSPFSAPSSDPILQIVGRILLPFLFLFGIYVVLNGHLSPGGGFSGGAILGGGLILSSSLFGQVRLTEKLTPRVTTILSVCCLLVYAGLKSYSFYTGANHVGWEIPKGRPGDILSAGFILPLNICVGIIVACTMFSFYSLFSQGEEE